MKNMTLEQQFMHNLYEAFNKREIETIISLMHSNVKWANGMEGGFVYGQNQVREYWRKQFEIIQPQLEILNFDTDANNRNLESVLSCSLSYLMIKQLLGKQ